MAAAQDADDQQTGLARQPRGDGLGHRAVPEGLRTDEAREGVRRRCVRGGRGRLRCTALAGRAGMGVEDLAQHLPVGLGRLGGSADALALGLAQRLEAAPADRRHHATLDIERQHRQPVHPGEMEERQVQAGVEAPDLVPLRAAQELGLRQPAGHPVVEHRLQPAREHLQPERQRRPARMQLRQDLELPAVVLGAVVALAEQHRLRLGHPAQQLGGGQQARCSGGRRQPLAGGLVRRTERGRRGRLGCRTRPGQHQHRHQQRREQPPAGRRRDGREQRQAHARDSWSKARRRHEGTARQPSRRSSHHAWLPRAAPGQARSAPRAAIRCADHSHSIVAGGLLETS